VNDYRLLITWEDGSIEEWGCPFDLKLPESYDGAWGYEDREEDFRTSLDLRRVRPLRVYNAGAL
jgi:hypothetical protein